MGRQRRAGRQPDLRDIERSITNVFNSFVLDLAEVKIIARAVRRLYEQRIRERDPRFWKDKPTKVIGGHE